MVALGRPLHVQTELWPELPLGAWQETRDTLHMWTQIVGKIRLALCPPVNHWWNVPLYVTARGLTTGAMPYEDRTLEIRFDLVEHDLSIESSDGRRKAMALVPRAVADFYQELMASLNAIEMPVRIWTTPVEVAEAIPFDQDRKHVSYDSEYAARFWQILLQTQQVFDEFRGRFVGKCSPVHFFWGSFDLAVTRFSGRAAPPRPGVSRIEKEAYSHECISHGFWPGGNWMGTVVDAPVYYSYTVPEPQGLRQSGIRPEQARFDPAMAEFVLRYDALRESRVPRQTLMEFLQSTYEAGANLAGWDRKSLERSS